MLAALLRRGKVNAPPPLLSPAHMYATLREWSNLGGGPDDVAAHRRCHSMQRE